MNQEEKDAVNSAVENLVARFPHGVVGLVAVEGVTL